MTNSMHIPDPDLSTLYQLMAADETREAEAHEWGEATCRDVADEPRQSLPSAASDNR